MTVDALTLTVRAGEKVNAQREKYFTSGSLEERWDPGSRENSNRFEKLPE